MAERQTGSGQWRKLFYTKHLSDQYGVVWKISTWKVFFILIAIAVALIIIYAFLFTSDAGVFLGDILFYSIVIILAVAFLWLTANTAIKSKKIITGFFIAFILILVLYWVLSLVFGYFGWIEFHMGGYSLWVLISILALMGARRIDGSLDKNDVGYGLLVFIVLLGANIPITDTGGFLANLDSLVEKVLQFIPLNF